MDASERILIALDRLKLDAEREGEDEYMRGQQDGLKHALAILVGEHEAARLLARKGR